MENLCENCVGSFQFSVHNTTVKYCLIVTVKNMIKNVETEERCFCSEQCLIEWLTKEKRHE